MNAKKYDVTIIGGGHNGLVAATYLAKAGKSVVILKANPEIGGAGAIRGGGVSGIPGHNAAMAVLSNN